jgi:quercetin dioxygenase-like cupin family protein
VGAALDATGSTPQGDLVVMATRAWPTVLAFMLGIVLGLVAASAQTMPAQVLLDNPSVRVTSLTLPPGSGTGRHQGLEPEVGILVDGEVTVESPQGRTLVRTGSAYYLPGLTPHDTRNEASRPARLIEVFLKRCD